MLKNHYNRAHFRLNGNKVGQQTAQHFQNDVLKERTIISQLDTLWISENLILQQETTGPDGRKVLQQLFICKFDAIRCSVLSREYSTPFIKRNIE